MCYIKLFRKNLALLKTEGRWVGYEAFMNLDFFSKCAWAIWLRLLFFYSEHIWLSFTNSFKIRKQSRENIPKTEKTVFLFPTIFLFNKIISQMYCMCYLLMHKLTYSIA